MNSRFQAINTNYNRASATNRQVEVAKTVHRGILENPTATDLISSISATTTEKRVNSSKNTQSVSDDEVENSETSKTSDKEEEMDEESDIESEDQWEVEYIMGHRYNKRKECLEIKIKWKGFPAKDATWEPLRFLKCDWLWYEYIESLKKL